MANDALNLALAEIITKASQTVSDGISFLSAELPEVARQVLTYNLYSSVVYFVLSLIGFLITIKLYLKFLKVRDKDDYSADEKLVFASLWGFLFGIIFLGILLCEVSTIIKIVMAPKLFLIEWTTSILK